MAFEDAIADDMDIFDGTQTVSITYREDDETVAVPKALLRKISTSEAANSNGQYLSSDVICNVRGSSIVTAPKVGDTLTDASDVAWTILAVHRATLGTRWRLILRDRSISSTTVTLDSLINIEVASYTKSDGGSQTATWSTLQEDVAAHIQDNGANAVVENGKREVEAQFSIFCEDQYVVGENHRIVDSEGTVYRVTGYRNRDSITDLYEILAEKWA